jgi:hypothetical protein
MDNDKYTVHLTELQLCKIIDMVESMIGLDPESDPFYEELLKTLDTE